jgi:Mg-chelatase subunit ChlD
MVIDRCALAGATLLAATVMSCGAGESESAFGSGAGAGGSSGADAGSDTGGGGTTPQPDAFVPLDSGPLGDATPTDAETCSAVSQTAERFPVDMVIMMDKSGSMSEAAGGTAQTKWQAVNAALASFVQDPSSADLGVGIQFFPLPVSTSLPTCTSTLGCTGNAVCVVNPATNQGNCQAICPGSGMCGTADCVPTGNPIYPGYCSNDNCDFAAYRSMQVEIATLPGAASAILSAMQGQTPLGGTPTFSAITGAIQHAQDWAAQHADHKVVVVLATDGLPTLCPVVQSAADEAHVIDLCKQAASDAVNGNPSVLTFVIGLGAVGNLDSIAVAGGTDHAFIVDPAQDVAKQFADALAAIRGSVMTCEFKLPDPDVDAGVIDYGKVNVQYTPGGGAQQTIYYVGNEASCDPDAGGWYYDTDPAQSVPTRIIMCPTTCDALQMDASAKVDIAIGCKSETPPPK